MPANAACDAEAIFHDTFCDKYVLLEEGKKKKKKVYHGTTATTNSPFFAPPLFLYFLTLSPGDCNKLHAGAGTRFEIVQEDQFAGKVKACIINESLMNINATF